MTRTPWRRRPPARVAAVGGVTVALAFAACGGGTAGPTRSATPKVDPTSCGLAAFARAPKPVNIVMWHVLQQSQDTWLNAATDRFNRSQGDVHVTLVQQPDYPDLFTKYKAGLTSGDLPDLAQFEETTVAQLVDSRSTVPVQACIDATHYDLSDFLPRALQYYAYDGVQRSMPWDVSNVVLYYDPTLFRKAGLDPARPPRTLAEVKEYSQRIVASGAASHGIALHEQPYVFEFLLAKSGGEYVNNGNGRRSRATAANLTGPVAMQLWSWWDDMVRSGLALDTGSDPASVDHLIAVANRSAAMTIDASSFLGPIEAVLASGQYQGVQFAAAPLPALVSGEGVPVGDGSLWLSARSAPEKRTAAWRFIQYLDAPEQQAELAANSAFAPIRTSSAALPVLADKWAKSPSYRVSYDQLTTGTVSDANIGSLIGDYQGVRDAVRDGMVQMLRNHLSPQAAAAVAEQEADARIRAYNARVPAGS